MKWDSFRSDLRAFGRLAHYNIAPREDARLIRLLLRGDPLITTVGVSLELLALVMCWRVACWPRSTTLIVTPQEKQAKGLLRVAHDLMSEADEELRERVLFLPGGKGLTSDISTKVCATHCLPGTLGLTLPVPAAGEEPLTFLVPDLDLISGPHQKYLSRFKTRFGTTVLANVLTHGRL